MTDVSSVYCTKRVFASQDNRSHPLLLGEIVIIIILILLLYYKMHSHESCKGRF